MTILLWAHGGSVFGSDRLSRLNDDRAEDAMRYMLELGKWMPPAVTTWDWNGAVSSFARGDVGVALMSGEYFPGLDDPASSKIVELAEPAPCPKETALRSPADCGFEESPGISRQGGSCLGISRYSKKQDAAWLLLQWATSSDITTRASLLGGGSSPIRASNYADPRTKARARVMVGTTRQFPVALDAIRHRMGTDPHLPAFDDLVSALAVELGKLTTGQQNMKTTLNTMARAADAIAKNR
jgi:multiple sugar transport system substrate-binding protein